MCKHFAARRQASEATVRVLADGKDVAFGAIVDADGWILTKWDEIRGAKKIVSQAERRQGTGRQVDRRARRITISPC